MSYVERYPIQDRTEWGPFYWKVLENLAATMSPKPKSQEKYEVKTIMKLLMKRLPCGECADHALDYVKKHPMNDKVMKDPESLFNYICTFHNDVNRRNNKPIVDCRKIYDPDMVQSQHCYDCFVNPNVIAADLGSSMNQYKETAIDIFEELCNNEGLPVPEIRWEPCRDYPSTSCGEFTKNGKNIIYLNPSNASLRVVLHEFDHYKDYVKDGKTTFSEEKANAFAEGKLQEHFNFDINKPITQDNVVLEEKIVAKYEADAGSRMVVGAYDPVRQQPSSFQSTMMTPSPMGPGVMTNYRESFPMYQQYVDSHKMTEMSQAEHESTKVGVLSAIDSFYKKPGEITGLPADDLNLFHTSLIIKNIVSTLIQTNTTKLGSMMFSAMLGITIFLTTTVMKKNIRHRDKQLLHLLAAGFTWDMISYINPKNSTELKEQLGSVIKNIKGGHPFSKDVTNNIFETPKSWKQKRKSTFVLGGGRQAGGGVGPVIAGGTPANVYVAQTTGNPDIDAVRSMVSVNAGSGTPISTGNLTPGEVGSMNAEDTLGTMIVDANNNVIGTQYGIGDKNVYVPRPVSEVEALYQSFYSQAKEGDFYPPQPQAKLETNQDYLYNRMNPYTYKQSY